MTSMEGLMDLKAFTIKGKKSRFMSILVLDIPTIVLDGLMFINYVNNYMYLIMNILKLKPC